MLSAGLAAECIKHATDKTRFVDCLHKYLDGMGHCWDIVETCAATKGTVYESFCHVY